MMVMAAAAASNVHVCVFCLYVFDGTCVNISYFYIVTVGGPGFRVLEVLSASPYAETARACTSWESESIGSINIGIKLGCFCYAAEMCCKLDDV